MRYPLRYTAYEWLQQKKSGTDDELLEVLNKNGTRCSPDELDKLLMQLEILGLVSIRWVSKDKRRVELVDKQADEPRVPKISE